MNTEPRSNSCSIDSEPVCLAPITIRGRMTRSSVKCSVRGRQSGRVRLFAWLNFFTNDLKDAVLGTTLLFLIDAQRNGNL
jgi:hypothetical protein